MKQLLNDLIIKNTKTPQTLKDGGGLFLIIETNGSKRWRYRYQFGGKAQMLSLGLYPDVSLKQARDKRDEMRAQVVAGINPSAKPKKSHPMDTIQIALSYAHANGLRITKMA